MRPNNFVTLTCPNCGAICKAVSNNTNFECEYCGSEFHYNSQTKEISLESYAACPLCRRNDKVEKVSSILASQIHHIEWTIKEKRAIQTDGQFHIKEVYVPQSATQSSTLAKKIIEPQYRIIPPKPQEPTLFSIKEQQNTGQNFQKLAIRIAAILFFSGLILGLISAVEVSRGGLFITFILIAIIVGAPIWFYGYVQLAIIEDPESLARLKKESKERQNAYLRLLKDWENQIEDNKRAKQNWEDLYYCYRDDCAFVPGSGKWTRIDNIPSYIYDV